MFYLEILEIFIAYNTVLFQILLYLKTLLGNLKNHKICIHIITFWPC